MIFLILLDTIHEQNMKTLSIYLTVFSIALTFFFIQEAKAGEQNFPVLLAQSLKERYSDQESRKDQGRVKREDLRVFYCYDPLNGRVSFSKEAAVNYIEVQCPRATYDKPNPVCGFFRTVVFKRDLSLWQYATLPSGIHVAKDSPRWKPIDGKNGDILVLESQKYELDLKANEYFHASGRRGDVTRYKCYPMD